MKEQLELEEKFLVLNGGVALFLKHEEYRKHFIKIINKYLASDRNNRCYQAQFLLDEVIPYYHDFVKNFRISEELNGNELHGIYFYLIMTSLKNVLTPPPSLEHQFFLLYDIHELLFGGR